MSGTLKIFSEIIVSLGDFNGHVGKCAEGFEGVRTRGEWYWEKKGRKEDCWSSVMKNSCAWQTLGFIIDKRKVTYSAGGCETEIDFVLVGEKYRKYVKM